MFLVSCESSSEEGAVLDPAAFWGWQDHVPAVSAVGLLEQPLLRGFSVTSLGSSHTQTCPVLKIGRDQACSVG